MHAWRAQKNKRTIAIRPRASPTVAVGDCGRRLALRPIFPRAAASANPPASLSLLSLCALPASGNQATARTLVRWMERAPALLFPPARTYPDSKHALTPHLAWIWLPPSCEKDGVPAASRRSLPPRNVSVFACPESVGLRDAESRSFGGGRQGGVRERS